MSIEKLPDERNAFTRKFAIKYIDEETKESRTLKFFVQTGMYPDGRLGEVFIRGDKIGGFISGALDALAMTISVGLQHGVPLEMITSKLRHNRFGPSGFTGDQTFRSCSSMFDLIAQYLDYKFPGGRMRDPLEGRPRDSEPESSGRCALWSYPGHESWDIKLDKPDGRQCALDAGHQGSHELVRPR